MKVGAEDAKRAEVLRIADIFRCKVVDVSPDELTLEITGDQEQDKGRCGPFAAFRRQGIHPRRDRGHAPQHAACRLKINWLRTRFFGYQYSQRKETT